MRRIAYHQLHKKTYITITKEMDKKIKDLELEKYGYNTRQRLELLSEENFSVCQHMMDKDIDKVFSAKGSFI